MKGIFPLFVFIILLAISCEKKSPTETSDGEDLSFFSGLWEGTLTIIQAGECPIEDSDSASYGAILIWTVNEDGEVFIKDSLQSKIDWSGNIQEDLSISLRKIFTVNCFGTLHTDTTIYDGVIESVGDAYHLSVESIEEWCPPECIFNVSYSINKM